MKSEDLSLLVQAIESMELASKELEKAMEEKNIERVRKAKQEILNFQWEIKKIVG